MASKGLFFGLCALVALAAPPAGAQSGDTAAAETLFQEGRSLFQDGRFAEACPKLAESHRLDPATGTLLALALCHEGEGKLASAWAEFVEVEGRASREGRTDRVEIAREHAAALKPRLSTLAVDVPPEIARTPGLELRVNGTVLGPGSFGVAVPVNGGEHRIEASAPGKAPWSMTISVKPESDAARVGVPPLADAPVAAAGPVPAAPAARGDETGSTFRTAGLVTAGAGVVALGIGTYLALDAKSDYDAAREQCDGTVCPTGPFRESEDARGRGTVATVLFVVGGTAVAAGATLWFLAPSHEHAAASAGPRVDRVGVGPGSLVVGGSF